MTTGINRSHNSSRSDSQIGRRSATIRRRSPAGLNGTVALSDFRAAGGGVDIKLSKHMAFRPIEFDYYLTRFSNPELGNNNQNNWRYSGGVNFLFGAK